MVSSAPRCRYRTRRSVRPPDSTNSERRRRYRSHHERVHMRLGRRCSAVSIGFVTAVALLACGCSNNTSRSTFVFPTPRPLAHKVVFAPEVFTPEPAPRQGILSAERTYQIWSGHGHWPSRAIAQFGNLAGVVKLHRPVKVWAFEILGSCPLPNGLGSATQSAGPAPIRFCRAWDFVNATNGKWVEGIGL